MISISRLSFLQPDFDQCLQALTPRAETSDYELEKRVRDIIEAVRTRQDAALTELTAQLDGLQVANASELELSTDRLQQALARIGPAQRHALEQAAARISAYHKHQCLSSWSYQDEYGNTLGQQITPLDRAGLYVPGGKAAYPSSVLMNALPARIAGVGELIMTVPAPNGDLNDMVLAAAAIAGVDRVFTIGGAQAIAALAHGTQTVPRVDKIVGPGNRYVAAAKRMVFGQVGIDMIAGPSEVVVVSDGSAHPDWVAIDMFAQAEHDQNARALLICTDADFLEAVASAMTRLLPSMQRADIIVDSLRAHGALIHVPDLVAAIDLVNQIAPEHLELAVADPQSLLPQIRHAGAIFLGHLAAEALGDYCAGPNHVLPTAATARFSSPLGVYDFQKRSSVISCTVQGASELGLIAAELARGERLDAHARSAMLRVQNKDA